jgi:hypothetical protein
MRRKKLLLVLFVLVSLFTAGIAWAQGAGDAPPDGGDLSPQPEPGQEKQGGGWLPDIKEILGKVFTFLVLNVLMLPVTSFIHASQGLLGMTVLREFQLNAHIFDAWRITAGIGASLILVMIGYGAVRGQIAPAAGMQSTDYRDMFPRALLAGAGVMFSYKLAEFMLWLNNQLVRFFLDIAGPENVYRVFMPDGVVNMETVLKATASWQEIPVLVVVFAVVLIIVLCLVIFQYLVRQVEIVLLTVIFPIVAGAFVIEEAAGLWGLVLGEFFVAVFMQTGAAMLLWLAIKLLIAGMGFGESDTLLNVFLYTGCIYYIWKIPDLLRRLVNAAVAGQGSMPSFYFWRHMARGLMNIARAIRR